MKTAKTHDRKTKKSKYSQHTPSKRLTTKPKNLNIVNENADIELLDSEMELYIKIIKEYIAKQEIIKLKEKLKNELDINKKVEIANKIANLKKEEEL